MGIQAAEISAILKDQIKNFGQDAEVAEVGRVLSVGDGIARVYGHDRQCRSVFQTHRHQSVRHRVVGARVVASADAPKDRHQCQRPRR